MRLDAATLEAGHAALFPPPLRAAQLAALLHAREARPDGRPTVPDCIAIARQFGVPASELAAFFGYLGYGEGGRTVWTDALESAPGSYVARLCATPGQLRALGFALAVADLHAAERRTAAH